MTFWFLGLWVALYLLFSLGRGMIPTTVQQTRKDILPRAIWAGAIAALLVILGAGVGAVIGGLF